MIQPPMARDTVPPRAHDTVPPRARDIVPPRARDTVPLRARDTVPPKGLVPFLFVKDGLDLCVLLQHGSHPSAIFYGCFNCNSPTQNKKNYFTYLKG